MRHWCSKWTVNGGWLSPFKSGSPVRFEHLPLETVMLFSVFAFPSQAGCCSVLIQYVDEQSLNWLYWNRNVKKLLPHCIETVFFHAYEPFSQFGPCSENVCGLFINHLVQYKCISVFAPKKKICTLTVNVVY